MDSRIAEAWKHGIEVEKIAQPSEGVGDNESAEVEYQAWRGRFQAAAQELVGELAGKSYGPQVYCALNGFCQYLRARAPEIVGAPLFSAVVDRYFFGGVYAESTERMYRRWIRKVVDKMEASNGSCSDARNGSQLGD